MDRSYADKYRELYKCHWWWRAREAWLEYVLNKYIKNGSNNTILDIGCGDGLSFPLLSKYGNVYGVEYDRQLLSEGNKWIENIQIGDFLEIKLEKTFFDIIIAMDVIEHIESDDLVVAKMYSHLNHGGYIIINVPAHSWLWTTHDNMNHHFRRYSPSTIENLIIKSGFDILLSRPLFAFTVPIKAIQSIVELIAKKSGLKPKISSDCIPTETINSFLTRYACWENSIFPEKGLGIGSSHFVVAQKR